MGFVNDYHQPTNNQHVPSGVSVHSDIGVRILTKNSGVNMKE
jgi:hypothetical protein